MTPTVAAFSTDCLATGQITKSICCVPGISWRSTTEIISLSNSQLRSKLTVKDGPSLLKLENFSINYFSI